MPPLRSTGESPEAGHPQYAGQYRLEACLGTGGMGVVHLATSASGLRLAVKVIHAEHASDPEFRARFRQEVAAARRVSGAFTAPVVDADPDAGRPWMATLFIEGPTLAERVKRNGPLESEELRRTGAGLAEALRDIHRAGVVHRDLKPSNVLLAPDGPKVIDFGISRPSDSDLRTETGKLIGTPPFMAPEQFQRPREVGPAADVFAMGAVLVHAATGRGPFDSDSPYIVAYQVVHNEPDLTGVPKDLVPLIRGCLAKEPEDRPTPYGLMVALRESSPSSSYDTLTHVPGPRTPDPRGKAPVVGGGSGPARTWSLRGGRKRWAAAGAAVAVLMTAGIVVTRAMGGESAPPSSTPAPTRTEQGSKGFVGWSVDLGERGAEDRMPACTAGPRLTALYCAAPGLKAARLDPGSGRRAWSRAAHAGAAQSGHPGAPVFAGGLVHVLSPGERKLEALDPETGAVRWHIGTAPYSAVRHVGDVVLLITDGGQVRAVDAATGEQRWSRRHGGPGTEWVAAAGGNAVAMAVTQSADGTSTLVKAVDPRKGKPLWKKRLDGLLRPMGVSGGALYLMTVDLGGFTDAVVRVDMAGPAHGIRTVALTAPVDQAQAVVRGDVVHLSGSGGSLVAVRMAPAGAGAGDEPRQLWRLETSVTNLSRPEADGRAVYVTAGDGRLLAVDAVRGSLIGQTEPRMDDGRYTFASFLPPPVAVGGRVFGVAPNGAVFAVDAEGPAGW
ncbi:PQQ-binding-like beta-propeller repeat protein [Streptomyces sp. NPDC004609]|uniref:serine/threonine-protein kinase n=1 Tax=Streptomyces sp. NPDC004609 TaxID=3364704 RepID=UPI0036B86453